MSEKDQQIKKIVPLREPSKSADNAPAVDVREKGAQVVTQGSGDPKAPPIRSTGPAKMSHSPDTQSPAQPSSEQPRPDAPKHSD